LLPCVHKTILKHIIWVRGIDMALRPVFIVGFILFAASSGQAFAQGCAGLPNLTGGRIATLVAGNYTCVGSSPNATWNELLTGSATGTVTDYKLGPSSPTDPTTQVGTYAVSGADIGVLVYSYTGGGSFSYNISGTSSPYNFCPVGGGGTTLIVNVQPGPC
jgi:hypothetical protein